MREPERSEGRTQGQGPFAYFWGCLPKVSRRKGGTRRKVLINQMDMYSMSHNSGIEYISIISVLLKYWFRFYSE